MGLGWGVGDVCSKYLPLLLHALAQSSELAVQVNNNLVPATATVTRRTDADHKQRKGMEEEEGGGWGGPHERLRAGSSSFSFAALNTMSSASV